MGKKDYVQKTENLALPLAESLGYEIVDTEYVKEGADWFLRVYIDKPGGITIDDCEALSRLLSDALDEEDFIADAYILEVSSPGLDRPLKKEKDFLRYMGEPVEVKTYQAFEGRKEFTGILTAYNGDSFTIEEDDTEITFTMKETALVRPAIEF